MVPPSSTAATFTPSADIVIEYHPPTEGAPTYTELHVAPEFDERQRGPPENVPATSRLPSADIAIDAQSVEVGAPPFCATQFTPELLESQMLPF